MRTGLSGGAGRSVRGLRRAPLRASLGFTLFLCLFAAQTGVIAVSPVLSYVAADFDVTTATAGLLRSVSGLAAGIVALSIGRLSERFRLRELLAIGLRLLAAGSLLSAIAPTFSLLIAAQVAVGAGLAIVLAAGLAAAGEWSPADRRAQVLSWALIGQPAAWILGMPLIGLIGDVSWRWGWVAVPFAASVLASVAVASCQSDSPAEPRTHAWRLLGERPEVAGWALSELLSYSAWAGTIVFAGALLVETYGASAGTAGLILGAGAIGYLPGNFLARRVVDQRARLLLALLPLAAAGLSELLCAFRPALWVSALSFAALAGVNGGRTIAGSAFGLEICAGRRVFAMRVRAAANQFGYLCGATLGGLALATGGFAAMGLVFAALFVLAAVPHLVAMGKHARPDPGPA